VALDLQSKGVDTTYPRAIYMSGLEFNALGTVRLRRPPGNGRTKN